MIKTIEYCPYRAQKHICRLDQAQCSLCLQGQQIDSIELLTSAVMNLSISMDLKKVNK